MAPEPRLGFEMTLLRMLAFRPATAAATSAASTTASKPAAAQAGRSQPAGASPGAATGAVPAAASPGGAPAARLTSIDAANWPTVVEAAALTGMAKQLALNCVPASFESSLLTLRLDQAAADWRTKPLEDKLVQALSKYLGKEIRVNFETGAAEVDTPAKQRLQAEQDRITRAASAFEADPAVKGLRERFGADVDAASVKPSN
jgi:DNA polymerase-3 subunit gamma/tau